MTSRMMVPRIAGPLVLLALAVAVGGGLSAAGLDVASPAPLAAGQEQPDQFVPVKSLPQQEQLPAGPLVVGAYGFVWVVLLVYVWSVWRRLLKVEREMRELAARIADRSGPHR